VICLDFVRQPHYRQENTNTMPKTFIIGLGRSGNAAAKLLKQDGWEVIVCDRDQGAGLLAFEQDLIAAGVEVRLGYTPEVQDLEGIDQIVVSPGVPWDIPLLVQARAQNIETLGELELAWRYLKVAPWIGITGTNGKTTTTALTAEIFQSAGRNAPACGNIGDAACELALEAKATPYDWIIAEISSYQIEAAPTLAPTIGLWTTFTPDHLNRHKTLDCYYAIKASLLARSEAQLINGDDPYLRRMGLDQWSEAYWTSVQGKEALPCDPAQGVYLQDNWVVAFGELIVPLNLFKMFGDHNHQNLLLAVGAARLAGIEKNAIATAIATFRGVPHRLETIRTLNGVTFINDSKATNYDAAEVGLRAVTSPTILIAGGEAKEGDDRQWIARIHQKAAAVLLIGDTAERFALRLQAAGYDQWEIVETMERAVSRGYQLALEKAAKGVLLSPACASFDQYRSFEHRGDDFRSLALALDSVE
jgi:UDP-N-acetylmuramoylalanine--D-glutamate ligase